MEAKTTWVPSKNVTGFTQVSVQKQWFKYHYCCCCCCFDVVLFCLNFYYFIINVPIALHKAEASQVVQYFPRHLVSKIKVSQKGWEWKEFHFKSGWNDQNCYTEIKFPENRAWPFLTGIYHLPRHCWS